MYIKIGKTALAALCVLVLTAVLSVSTVAADGYRLVEKKLTDSIDVGIIEKSGILRAAQVPSSYDLRDYNRVTSVKDQGNYGSCWAFAAAAAGESSLLTENPGKYANIDLSELHMLYFSFKKTSDPLGGTQGDGVVIPANENFLDIGNNFYGATFLLAKWVGAASESTLSYKLASPGLNVSMSKAFTDAVHLENAEWISMKDTAYIKSTIMKKGALSTSYYCNDDKYLNEDTCAYYCNRAYEGNHAVTIIGWDDNYSKNNFGGAAGTVIPSANGAWLVKASYGTDYGDKGYIWISYKDASLLKSEAVYYDYAGADNYEHNYQYDGGQNFGYYEVKSGCGYMANNFTAVNDEILKAVSFYTVDTDTMYDITVFTDIPSSGVPVLGTAEPQSTVSGAFAAAGYHTVKLPSAVTLDKGSRFSVVIRLRNSGKTTKMMIDSTANMGSGIANVTKSAAQQSVISENGTQWLDLYSSSAFVKSGTNFRIKAFTDDGYINTSSAAFKSKTVTMSPGKTEKLNITFTPSNATGRFTWTSSDPSVAKVSSAGKVTAVSCGSCKITAKSVRGGSTASCVIKVKPGKVTGLKSTVTGDTSYKLTWNAAEGASVYRLYKYNSTKDSFVKLCDLTATYYTVKNAVPGAVSK
ncbi:MAG: lectin like domain-containing protein [Clostridia bacterium]|nr:lectin like domain-containing protein [Clostridia bacterium]